MADLHFTEDFIGITPEKKHQFEIFIRTELGEIINVPSMGWKAEDLMVNKGNPRYQQTLEFVLDYARLEDLDFTGELTYTVDEQNRTIIKVDNIQFLKEDKFLLEANSGD